MCLDRIFTSKTLNWKQVSVIKMASGCFGVAIGAYWADIFAPYVLWFVVAGLVFGLYAGSFWFRKD
jgi:hypothetical protein